MLDSTPTFKDAAASTVRTSHISVFAVKLDLAGGSPSSAAAVPPVALDGNDCEAEKESKPAQRKRVASKDNQVNQSNSFVKFKKAPNFFL